MKNITFETKCWESDWLAIVKNGGYQLKILSLENTSIDKKILIINNVNDPKLVCNESDKLVSNGIIDEWYLVDDYKNTVLTHFDLTENSFNGGYYYSISELVSIYVTKTDYLLHLSSDSNIESNNNTEWVNDAINIMETNPNVKCANPVWNHSYINANSDSNGNEDKNWYYIQRFSDQCYLIPQKYFNQKIYNEKNYLADIHYPNYGGESFEKKVYSHFKNNGFTTITNKRISYIHPNYF
jgi:hypothetical protein